MLARIAHELFWLGRYVARAEHTARMLDGVFQTDLAERLEDPRDVELTWPALLAILGARPEGRSAATTALARLTLDPTSPRRWSAASSQAREGARTVRDVISADMWEVVNTTHLVLQRPDVAGAAAAGPCSVYRYVKERSALFWGLTARTMLRDEADSFLERRRADRVGRHGAADAAGGAARRRATTRPRTARPRRCCRPSAASRRSGARCRRRRTRFPRRASCSTSAPIPTPSPPSVASAELRSRQPTPTRATRRRSCGSAA